MRERGDGETTRQMIGSPPDAIYIWCNDNLYYPKLLARKLHRNDLKIKGPSSLDRHDLYGLCVQIVLDHAAKLSERQAHMLEALICR